MSAFKVGDKVQVIDVSEFTVNEQNKYRDAFGVVIGSDSNTRYIEVELYAGGTVPFLADEIVKVD